MSSGLEKYIRDNREEFDGDEPSPELWKKLQKELQPPQVNKRIHRMAITRWSAVAAVTLLVTFAAFYFMDYRGRKDIAGKASNTQTNDIINAINPDYAKEVYHFTQLIELKQNELKKVEREQPELYKAFIGDITILDSSYNALKKDLPQNPNREQLLEAMIDNLRLQTELLNQQLLIIKKIKQAKQTSNESNSKSI
jgi:hypothetical protein